MFNKTLRTFGTMCAAMITLMTMIFVNNCYAVDYSTYTTNDLIFLARVINVEADDGCTDEHKELVGAVVMNRVKDSRFPNTIWDVVYQKGQYACLKSSKFWGEYPSQRSIQAAKNVLDGAVKCPSNVIYQAEFVQGKGVYKQIYVNTGWYSSTTYFCYG